MRRVVDHAEQRRREAREQRIEVRVGLAIAGSMRLAIHPASAQPSATIARTLSSA